MNTLNRIISVLLVSATAALLGAGCVASDEPVNAGNDNDTEEGATIGSVQEAQRFRCPRGYRPLGNACIPISGNYIDTTPTYQCPGGTLVTPGGNVFCLPLGPRPPVFEAPRHGGRR
jgi:hypothetical protein